jgi:hypothetical protein
MCGMTRKRKNVSAHMFENNCNKSRINEVNKRRLNSGNSCYRAVQNSLSSRLVTGNVTIKIHICNLHLFCKGVNPGL